MSRRYVVASLSFTLLICLSCCGAFAAEGDGETEDLARRLEQLLSTYEQYGFSGAVLVSKGDRIVLEAGYGFANRETGERNTPQTRFDFASIAKTFTGAAVLSLAADGALSVDDRLETHLGPFPERKSAATIHHLATHSAGLAHRSKSELDYSRDRQVWVQSMKDAPFETEPGSSYRYSNAGTSLLAALVEEVAGQPFEMVVRERLFEPAGLKSTGFYPEFERGTPGVAMGYRDETDAAAPPEYDDWRWGVRGSTGIVSTIGDVHSWFQALRAGKLLPAEQVERAFDPQETEAYGWHTETDERGRTFIHKGGGLAAMQTQILAYPDQDVVIVWAHNDMTRNWRQALNRGLSALMLGEPYVLPLSIVVPGASGAGLAGSWQTTSGTRLLLVETQDGLGVGGNGFGLPQGPLRSAGEGVWTSFDVERVSSFALSMDADGILRVALEPEGERLTLSRTRIAAPASLPLEEPSAAALEIGRQASAWILGGNAEALWNASAYRPVRGSSSRQGWEERVRFLARRVGGETRLIEEAWVRREGSWRYWRTFESSEGMEVVLRFGISGDGKILTFGVNPRGSEPGFDEKKALET